MYLNYAPVQCATTRSEVFLLEAFLLCQDFCQRRQGCICRSSIIVLNPVCATCSVKCALQQVDMCNIQPKHILLCTSFQPPIIHFDYFKNQEKQTLIPGSASCLLHCDCWGIMGPMDACRIILQILHLRILSGFVTVCLSLQVQFMRRLWLLPSLNILSPERCFCHVEKIMKNSSFCYYARKRVENKL